MNKRIRLLLGAAAALSLVWIAPAQIARADVAAASAPTSPTTPTSTTCADVAALYVLGQQVTPEIVVCVPVGP